MVEQLIQLQGFTSVGARPGTGGQDSAFRKHSFLSQKNVPAGTPAFGAPPRAYPRSLACRDVKVPALSQYEERRRLYRKQMGTTT